MKPDLSLHRRDFLKTAAGATLTLAASRGFSFAPRHNDDALLDDLSRRCFQYFVDAIDPETGICKDLIHGDPADSARKQDDVRGLYRRDRIRPDRFVHWRGAQVDRSGQGEGPGSPLPAQLHQWQGLRDQRMVLSLQRCVYGRTLERGGGFHVGLHLASCCIAHMPPVLSRRSRDCRPGHAAL